MKITDETPRPPGTALSAWGMAVPGATYEGVFPALGLHDARPVTTAGGLHASEGQEIGVVGPAGEETVVGRVFVTPELDGWRLVFGSSDRLIGDDPWDGMTDVVERVSSHCGHAQLFFLDDAGGSDVWFVAENGRVIRRFAADGDPEWEGDPLPWETSPPTVPDPATTTRRPTSAPQAPARRARTCPWIRAQWAPAPASSATAGSRSPHRTWATEPSPERSPSDVRTAPRAAGLPVRVSSDGAPS
ncbi:hypothetical protein [Streptomyces sp. NRRL S-378]|uniref:hypothetical protein n=1 Tax=Streptomyces sp. NRRL S-378 TaxID=1463904 RepID=UPI00068EBB1C|nr:hypothetical protein [Streptomyces sp. NRRL S-378]